VSSSPICGDLSALIHLSSLTPQEPKLFYETEVEGFDSNNFETKQVFYNSKDGTRIPMFLVYPKGVLSLGSSSFASASGSSLLCSQFRLTVFIFVHQASRWMATTRPFSTGTAASTSR
jgi:hypothetical protein